MIRGGPTWRATAVVLVAVALIVGAPTQSLAAQRPKSPASFVLLAQRGIEGTFSAVYRLTGPARSEDDGTVAVAQRARARNTPWPGGRPGEWSYRLTMANGSTVEWLARDNSLEDCWREKPSAQWRCTGPGRDSEVAGSIGYEIATLPFLPGSQSQAVAATVRNETGNRSVFTVRSIGPIANQLTCLHDRSTSQTWCLNRYGFLVSVTGEGWIGYSWMTARLISERGAVPAGAFTLSGTPREPYALPPT